MRCRGCNRERELKGLAPVHVNGGPPSEAGNALLCTDFSEGLQSTTADAVESWVKTNSLKPFFDKDDHRTLKQAEECMTLSPSCLSRIPWKLDGLKGQRMSLGRRIVPSENQLSTTPTEVNGFDDDHHCDDGHRGNS